MEQLFYVRVHQGLCNDMCFCTSLRVHQVYEFVKLDELFYAGSHGMDIRGPPRQLKSYDDKYQTRALDEKVSCPDLCFAVKNSFRQMFCQTIFKIVMFGDFKKF